LPIGEASATITERSNSYQARVERAVSSEEYTGWGCGIGVGIGEELFSRLGNFSWLAFPLSRTGSTSTAGLERIELVSKPKSVSGELMGASREWTSRFPSVSSARITAISAGVRRRRIPFFLGDSGFDKEGRTEVESASVASVDVNDMMLGS
jgi:hypothetical protein